MFLVECTYQPTVLGLLFLPGDADTDYPCDLRVSFEPLGFYPAEPDVGAGRSYEVGIAGIEMMDYRDKHIATPWRQLRGRAFQAAKAFLDRHCREDLWAQADAEAARHFSDFGQRRVA